jgi:copper(I)-binding protein
MKDKRMLMKMNRNPALLTLLLIVLAAIVALSACGPSGPEISVENAWVRPDPLMENAAGYLVIKNDGDQPDALIGVHAEFVSMTSVHQTVMEGEMHGMEPVPRLEIPAGSQVELRPLSYHFMMMGLKESLDLGQTVTMILECENSGQVTVLAEVRQQ